MAGGGRGGHTGRCRRCHRPGIRGAHRPSSRGEHASGGRCCCRGCAELSGMVAAGGQGARRRPAPGCRRPVRQSGVRRGDDDPRAGQDARGITRGDGLHHRPVPLVRRSGRPPDRPHRAGIGRRRRCDGAAPPDRSRGDPHALELPGIFGGAQARRRFRCRLHRGRQARTGDSGVLPRRRTGPGRGRAARRCAQRAER